MENLIPYFPAESLNQLTNGINKLGVLPDAIGNTPFFDYILLPLFFLSLQQDRNAPKTSKTFNESYDFIVVGGGSAGSTVAGRLSEIPCVSVLLIEAGPRAPVLNDVPNLGRTYWNSPLDWKFKTIPQKYTGNGMKNKTIPWPSGKGLGGSGLLNDMLFVRGNKKNYDDWAKMGATGWSYAEVLPYFKKMEGNDNLNNEYHNTSGPMSVEKLRYKFDLKDPVNQWGINNGYNYVDSNGANQRGFAFVQTTTRKGQRCSAAKGYLVPAEDRPNLTILEKALALRIIIVNNKAVGVEFEHDGKIYNVTAKAEVIMTAGATNTAQLLMLSGVGPSDELQSHGIPVIQDLPVGKNMQDHCSTFNMYTQGLLKPNMIAKCITPTSYVKYLTKRRGPLAAPEGVSNLAFMQSDNDTSKADDIELYVIEGAVLKEQFGVTDEFYQKVFLKYQESSLIFCLASVVQPFSRGTVKLYSSDPKDPPKIDPNYFSDDRDMTIMIKGMKLCNKMMTSDEVKAKGVKPIDAVYPGCEDKVSDEDAYLECQARSFIMTMSHQVSTCKMGNVDDSTTVVDPQLRVKGLKGLRVADASVMPIVPSGNTNVPTIMVAEKASDIIKNDITCDCP